MIQCRDQPSTDYFAFIIRIIISTTDNGIGKQRVEDEPEGVNGWSLTGLL